MSETLHASDFMTGDHFCTGGWQPMRRPDSMAVCFLFFNNYLNARSLFAVSSHRRSWNGVADFLVKDVAAPVNCFDNLLALIMKCMANVLEALHERAIGNRGLDPD